MRLKIAGNWKMNLGFKESLELYEGIFKYVESQKTKTEVILFPQTTASSIIAERNRKAAGLIKVGVQNISEFESGAYTGENSAKLCKEIGFDFCLIGHSERRHVFKEENKVMDGKVTQGLKNSLSVMYCIGETLKEREENRMKKVLEEQLQISPTHFNSGKVTLAYEPVWAIGTGKVATKKEIYEAHKLIREILDSKGLKASEIQILYGGSVNLANSLEILETEGVDGLLIGGASLKLDEFCKIISLKA